MRCNGTHQHFTTVDFHRNWSMKFFLLQLNPFLETSSSDSKNFTFIFLSSQRNLVYMNFQNATLHSRREKNGVVFFPYLYSMCQYDFSCIPTCPYYLSHSFPHSLNNELVIHNCNKNMHSEDMLNYTNVQIHGEKNGTEPATLKNRNSSNRTGFLQQWT